MHHKNHTLPSCLFFKKILAISGWQINIENKNNSNNSGCLSISRNTKILIITYIVKISEIPEIAQICMD